MPPEMELRATATYIRDVSTGRETKETGKKEENKQVQVHVSDWKERKRGGCVKTSDSAKTQWEKRQETRGKLTTRREGG